MIHLRPARVVVAIAAAALTLPAAALAHTQVWQTTALVNCSLKPGAPASPAHVADDVQCTEQQIYVLRLDGTTLALRETNGRTLDGTLDYQRIPTLVRRSAGFDLFNHSNPHIYPGGGGQPHRNAISGAQPHATCEHPSLDNDAAIRAWQPNHGSGLDPLFAYVPFQRSSGGLRWNPDEDPAKWMPVVLQHTGVDLTRVQDTEAGRRNACETVIGGKYWPADEVQLSIAALSSVTVAQAVAPLQARIGDLESQLAAGGTPSQAPPSQALTAAQAEIAALKQALAPLDVALPSSTPRVSSLAANGITVGLSGPAQQTFRTRLKLSALDAKRLRMSAILATTSVTFDAAGKASARLKPSAAAATRLRKAKRNLAIAVEIAGGDRVDVATATARR